MDRTTGDPARSRTGGACAALLGLSYLLLAVWYVLMPADQQSNAPTGRFFESLARDPSPSVVKFAIAGIGALLALGAAPAIARLVRGHAPDLVGWATNVALVGFAAVLFDSARFIAYEPGRARAFVVVDAAARQAIQIDDPLTYLDANGWFGFVGVGAWIAVVSLVALRSRALPRPLALLGLLVAIGYWLIGAGFTFDRGDLFLAGALVGGLLAGPAFFAWIGLRLWRGDTAPSGAPAAAEPGGRPVVDPTNARALLASSALFAALPADTIDRLAARLRWQRVPAGTVLIRQGDPGDCCYLLASGEAEVWQRRGPGAEPDGPWQPDPARHALLARMQPGDLFGEMALLLQQPRTSTVWAAGDLAVYALDAAALEAVVAAQPDLLASLEGEMLLRTITSALGTRSPLSALGPEALRWVARRFRARTVEAGQDVFRAGDPGDALYVVRSGRAAVLRPSEAGEQEVAALKPGDAFGEQALVTGEPRSATIRAVERLELLALDRADFQQVVRQFPDRARYFVQLTLQRQRPRRIDSAVLEKVAERDGHATYVLKDTVSHRYMKLSERGVFLWELMDGQRSVRDLAQAYFLRYKVIGIDEVLKLMVALGQAGFVETQQVDRQWFLAAAPNRLLRVLGAIQPWLVRYVSLPDVEGFVTAAHRLVWWLFTRPVQAALLLVALGGAGIYAARLIGGGLPGAGSGVGSLALLGFAAFAVQGVLHELAHALTTKHFGREVHRAGVGWYLFMPVAFVDTSDMWLAGRWQRAAVAFAGPYTNFVLAGLATLALPLAPSGVAQTFLVHFASTGYVLGILNLNPLVEMDGYYVLMDALDIPNLRAHALAFLGGLLFRTGRAAADRRRALVFRVYGVLTVAYTAFVATSILTAYQTYLRAAFASVLPALLAASLGWALAALMCGLILNSLWTGLRAGRA